MLRILPYVFRGSNAFKNRNDVNRPLRLKEQKRSVNVNCRCWRIKVVGWFLERMVAVERRRKENAKKLLTYRFCFHSSCLGEADAAS